MIILICRHEQYGWNEKNQEKIPIMSTIPTPKSELGTAVLVPHNLTNEMSVIQSVRVCQGRGDHKMMSGAWKMDQQVGLRNHSNRSVET